MIFDLNENKNDFEFRHLDVIEDNLNEAQFQAVTTTEGFVRVIAGAGSGKTRALTHRFAYLVNNVGIMPGNILCVTFTNKAAQEMRQRIHKLTGDNDTGYINTFHGFCVSVLSEESNAVGYPSNFIVLDNSDIDTMLGIIYEERGLTMRDRTFSSARDMIEMQKTKHKPKYYEDLVGLSIDALHEKYMEATDTDEIIFYGYLYQEKKCFGLDYNDLIVLVLHIFEINEEIKRKWQQRLEYIMIDEFQDIDLQQYDLMRVLCDYHKNLFVVGDPDQTIYSWRGADSRYLMNFDKNFKDTKTIMMVENYRSSPEILDAANALIEKNTNRIEKKLIPKLPNEKKVLYHHAKSSKDEAVWVHDKIRQLEKEGVRLGDICILYRAHYLSRNLEEVFLHEKLPYHIYSGVQFFDRMEIKDTLSYLRMLAYMDDLSFMRIVNVPKRNMGKRRMEFLKVQAEKDKCTLYQALCSHIDDEIFKGTKAKAFISMIKELQKLAEELTITELLAKVLERSGYEALLRTEGSQERLDNLAELKQSVYEFETTCGEEAGLKNYLEHVALFTNIDEPVSYDKVKMMTIHAAKGLEFPYVFLCGMSEDIFPSKKVNTAEAMEEERRLCFVALTRAEKGLFLTEAEGRNYDGEPRYPSRFILNIEEKNLEFDNSPEQTLINGAKSYAEYKDRLMPDNIMKEVLSPGAKVRHEVFGNGTILGFDEEMKAHIVQFDNIATARKISVKVKLQILG